jgi:hypothetical protein
MIHAQSGCISPTGHRLRADARAAGVVGRRAVVRPSARGADGTGLALSTLSRTEQLDVLRATAHYYGLVVVMEPPR